ncbi:Ars binding protein [Pleurostoma richardsiae]|uniref:Ars binding protein n=1 Tax=Pleurostoma richardsiae TaxID=41990 RepID=A0AA38S4P8_9PEZI|nr:Ars binding protein [Pleurostoma richardsiae]
MLRRAVDTSLTASSSAVRNAVPRPLGVRPTLPDRNVTADTIDDAYVEFILYCNPAVPLETDTTVLREAFRTPPKSGGKSFSTFTLFELIRQLESKEIKTWAELALKLGVEPPDQDRGQSSQKIQQYAVRLKRWMHSMHVDAFFEYLLNNPHPYWTQIPTTPNPVSDVGRDGVAAEDDMALRALLPQIRPRRGRKRPEEEELNGSPSQRPRIESPAMPDEFNARGVEQLDLWSAQPDSRNSAFVFPPPDSYSRLNPSVGQPQNMSWTGQDISQTPLTAYPQSAITPSTRNAFWSDPSEPKSAITPSKPKMNRRHGAKVVSSAWRSGGPGGTGKTRGRPPINRNDLPAMDMWEATATDPFQIPQFPQSINNTNTYGQHQPPSGAAPVQFQDPHDRTNMEELESFFIQELIAGDWKDGRGNPGPKPSVEEAHAIVTQIVEDVRKKAITKEGFLINIAALAGGHFMKTTTTLQCYRLDESDGQTKYLCNWELRLGDIRGAFSMRETVRHDRWMTRTEDDAESSTVGEAEEAGGAGGSGGDVRWQQKYLDLLEVMKKKDQELTEIKRNVMGSLKVLQPEHIRKS